MAVTVGKATSEVVGEGAGGKEPTAAQEPQDPKAQERLRATLALLKRDRRRTCAEGFDD